MPRLTHEEAVERIRALDQREKLTAFEMGDVALARCPLGDSRANNGGTAELERLAEDAGIPLETLRQRRYVASRIPHGMRLPSVSWTVYQEIAGSDEMMREDLLTRVSKPNPDHPKERWTVEAVKRIKYAPTPMPKFQQGPLQGGPLSESELQTRKTFKSVITALDLEGILLDLAEQLEKAEKRMEPLLTVEPPEGVNFGRIRWAASYVRTIVARIEDWTLSGKSDVDVFFAKTVKEAREAGK